MGNETFYGDGLNKNKIFEIFKEWYFYEPKKVVQFKNASVCVDKLETTRKNVSIGQNGVTFIKYS